MSNVHTIAGTIGSGETARSSDTCIQQLRPRLSAWYMSVLEGDAVPRTAREKQAAARMLVCLAALIRSRDVAD